MKRSGKILLVDDDQRTASSLKNVLERDGYEVVVESRGEDGLARATGGEFDLVITDFRMPGLNGLELIQRLHPSRPRLPIILMTAFSTTETAIEATKSGAYDYLLKPFDMEDLLDLAGKAIASSRLMSEPVEMGQGSGDHDAIVGDSHAMQKVYKEIGRVAKSNISLLILGETGTGKELVARAAYQHSDRSDMPFIAINCAAIPDTLLESELFGHEKGTFTGAEFRRIGRFEQANGGTLFLDEIGDLSSSTQSKLLRVLQEKSIQRLGGKETISVDVRVIAATHCDLESAIKNGRFREDLYYRLNAVTLRLPPLRDRREDIPSLVHYFIRRHGAELELKSPSIQPEVVRFLQEQTWPGNVRELQNVVRQSLLLAREYTISVEHVRQLTDDAPKNENPRPALEDLVRRILDEARNGKIEAAHAVILETVEREIFAQAIRLSRGNQARAARWLGVSRLTLREKLNRFGLHPLRSENQD